MLNLRQFRSRDRGVSDLLPYAALIAPGVVLCKDGTLLAGFICHGQDTASSTDDELGFVSAQFNNAIKLLGSGWMLHTDAVRSIHDAYSNPEDSYFPDPFSQLIDDERRAYFSGGVCYRTKTTIILSYRPNFSAEKMSSAAKTGGGNSTSLERSLEYFQNTLLEFEDALSAVLRLQRLAEYSLEDEFGNSTRYSDLLTHLQLSVTGVEHPVQVPATPM